MKSMPSSVHIDLRLLVLKALLKKAMGALLRGKIHERMVLLISHLYRRIIIL